MGILSHFRTGFHNVFFRNVLFGTIASVAVFISSWDHMERNKDANTVTHHMHDSSFDFVIVGGGSAGSVLASRLSENYRVLLLEAGGNPHPFSSIPNFAFSMLNYPEIDWMHKTVPQQQSCFALPNRQSVWSQGKSLGGSSNLNFLVHLRGHPKDFDHWSKITGDPSWSYENVLPYFKKSESFHGPPGHLKEFHGYSGPMNIEIPDYRGLSDTWIKAGKELGYKHVDLNSGFVEGFDKIYSPIRNGRRDAVFRSYLQPSGTRSTLTVYKYSHVNKIIMKEGTNEAIGVEYERHGMNWKAYAKKEIIISAGTVQTAKLLMLSGIGPAQHLHSVGIPVKADLPVGKNLQDHLSTFIGPFFVKEGNSFSLDRDVSMRSFAQFAFGKGPLTTTGIQATALLTSAKAQKRGEWDWADIQLNYMGFGTHNTFPQDFAHTFNLKEEVAKNYYNHARGKDTFMIMAATGRPRARGEITLRNSHPYTPPLIDPRYLENDHDLQVMLEAVKLSLKLVENTTAFQDVDARYSHELLPGCEHFPFRSDAYLECHIRHLSLTLHNFVGTCAMGPYGSRYAVVDPELRVIGINKLRVIDASVMPTIVTGNTQAATIMIAEKGADLIKKTWKHPHLQTTFEPPTIKPLTYTSPLFNFVSSPSYNVFRNTSYDNLLVNENQRYDPFVDDSQQNEVSDENRPGQNHHNSYYPEPINIYPQYKNVPFEETSFNHGSYKEPINHEPYQEPIKYIEPKYTEPVKFREEPIFREGAKYREDPKYKEPKSRGNYGRQINHYSTEMARNFEPAYNEESESESHSRSYESDSQSHEGHELSHDIRHEIRREPERPQGRGNYARNYNSYSTIHPVHEDLENHRHFPEFDAGERGIRRLDDDVQEIEYVDSREARPRTRDRSKKSQRKYKTSSTETSNKRPSKKGHRTHDNRTKSSRNRNYAHQRDQSIELKGNRRVEHNFRLPAASGEQRQGPIMVDLETLRNSFEVRDSSSSREPMYQSYYNTKSL